MANFARKLILVTGASGFIGKNLSEYLLKKDYKVRIIVHTNRVSQYLLANNKLEIVRADISNLKSLVNVTRGVHAVVNLAARKSDESDSFKVNVTGTKNLLKASELNSVKKFVQISSMAVKLPKKGTYGRTKELAERIVMASKIPFVILRVSLVYGNELDGIFGMVAKFSNFPVVPVFGDGRQVSYPIHVDDLCQTIEKAITNNRLKNRLWEVGGKDGITFDELIKKIAAHKNKNPLIVHIPCGIGLQLAYLMKVFLKKPPITVSNILGGSQDIDINLRPYFKNFGLKSRSLNVGLKRVLINGEDKIYKEVKILCDYILSPSKVKFNPSHLFVGIYKKATKYQNVDQYDMMSRLVLKVPWMLSGVEALLGVFPQKTILERKIFTLSALLECHPVTSSWLLPKERNFAQVLKECLVLSIRISVKYLFGLFLSPLLILRNKR